METTPINSTTEDRLIHNSRLEKDKDQGYRNVVQQNIYEEKLANNGLYATVFMHLFVIMSTVFIVLSKTNLVSVYHDNNPDKETINFSLLQFNLHYVKNKTNAYSYFCIVGEEYSNKTVQDDDDISPYSQCIAKESCVERGLNTSLIRDLFEFNCDYAVVLGLGNLMGLFTCGVVVLLLYDRISLDNCETYIFFTKFECAAYFLGFFFYFSAVGIFMELNSRFLMQDWLLIILFIISFSNFLVFRRSFYNKLRIRARIV